MNHRYLLVPLLFWACADDTAEGTDGSVEGAAPAESSVPPPLDSPGAPPEEAQTPPQQEAPPAGGQPPPPDRGEADPPAPPPDEEEAPPDEEPPPPDADEQAPDEEAPPEAEPRPIDECADAGDACDTCACRVCAAELDTCFADQRCEAVVECAQRTGCDGIACLDACGAEIDAAGGAFSDPVRSAQALGDCRDDRCGADPATCGERDPGPPQPEPAPDDPPEAPDDERPEDAPDEPPRGEDCDRFGGDRFCGEGVVAGGAAYCEFYVETDDRTCDDFCAAAGSFCLDGWSDEDDDCVTDDRVGCDDRANDQICRCAR